MQNKSRFLLPLLLLTFLSELQSQTYIKGFAVSHTGDTLQGEAMTDAYGSLSSSIRFKLSNGTTKELRPEQYKTIKIQPDWLYVAERIKYRHLGYAYNGMYFLRVLAETDGMRLLKFEKGHLEGFYVQPKGDSLYPLYTFLVTNVVFNDGKFRSEGIVRDTLAYRQTNLLDPGNYKEVKAYLFELKRGFPNCENNLLTTYKLTEDDLIDAVKDLASCVGTPQKVRRYFKKAAWRPVLTTGLGFVRVGKKDVGYDRLFSGSIFLGYADARHAVKLGFRGFQFQPSKVFTKSGNWLEWTARYENKFFLRPKFSLGGFIGISYIHDVEFANNLGLASLVQVRPNHFVGLEYNATIFGLLNQLFGSDLPVFKHYQLRYDYRF